MKKALKIGGVLFLLLAIYLFNSFVYPFSSTNPNYADVERVFNKMQFPAEWQEIRSSENRGIAGRACPIESESACYHKAKYFKVPENITPEDIKQALIKSGCETVAVSDNTYKGEPKNSYNFECSVDGLNVGSTYRGPESEVYVSVST